MDDWVVLAPTRWKLRAAIRGVNEVMAELLVRQHPDKTFIGRIARGFAFLGYRFSTEGLAVAPQTVERCNEQVSRRYAHGADDRRIGTYLGRWVRWVRAGLGGTGLQGSARKRLLCSGCPRCHSHPYKKQDLSPSTQSQVSLISQIM
jgi:hypothetical protein